VQKSNLFVVLYKAVVNMINFLRYYLLISLTTPRKQETYVRSRKRPVFKERQTHSLRRKKIKITSVGGRYPLKKILLWSREDW